MKSIQKIIAVFAVLMCMVNSGGESATNAPKFEGKKVTVKAVYVYEAISEQTENTLVAVKGKLASTEDIKKALANLPEGVLIYLDLSGVTGLTEIGKEAFKEESNTFHHLAGIVLPNSVTQIGDWAFCGCTSLESVTIPYSVTQIGWQAFYDCDNLVITFEGTERQWNNANAAVGNNYVFQEVLFPNDDKNYYYDE